MIVIGLDYVGPIQCAAQNVVQRLFHLPQHRTAIRTRISPRPSDVVQVLLSGVEHMRDLLTELLRIAGL